MNGAAMEVNKRPTLTVGDEVRVYVQAGSSRFWVSGTVTEIMAVGFRVRMPAPMNASVGIRYADILRHSLTVTKKATSGQ